MCYPPVSTLASGLRSLCTRPRLAPHSWLAQAASCSDSSGSQAARSPRHLLRSHMPTLASALRSASRPSHVLPLWSPPLPVSSSTLRKANLNPVSSPIVLFCSHSSAMYVQVDVCASCTMLPCLNSLRTSVYMREEVSLSTRDPLQSASPPAARRPAPCPTCEPILSRTSALHTDGPTVRRVLQLRRCRVALTS